MGWLAALGAALAVWWWLPPRAAGLGRLASGPPVATPRHGAWGGAWARGGVAWWALVGVGVVVGAALLGGPRTAAWVSALVQVGALGLVLGTRRARRVGRATRRAEVADAGELVAGLLRVGRVPSAALVEAATDAPVLAVAAAEQRAGGEASVALRRMAGTAGHEGLADLAAGWEVSVRTGASLVEAVDAATVRLAADAEVARVVEAELAAARLGGRVMAVLPVVGLALGYAFGGDPLAFLLGSPVGWACLNVGVALACGGVLWIDTIAERAGAR